MIAPEQCRAARGLLGWTQRQLADAAGVSANTVIDFEAGRRKPIRVNMEAIMQALEAAGVEFLAPDNGGPGVRLRSAE